MQNSPMQEKENAAIVTDLYCAVAVGGHEYTAKLPVGAVGADFYNFAKKAVAIWGIDSFESNANTIVPIFVYLITDGKLTRKEVSRQTVPLPYCTNAEKFKNVQLNLLNGLPEEFVDFVAEMAKAGSKDYAEALKNTTAIKKNLQNCIQSFKENNGWDN
jgi:hypothetical protein